MLLYLFEYSFFVLCFFVNFNKKIQNISSLKSSRHVVSFSARGVEILRARCSRHYRWWCVRRRSLYVSSSFSPPPFVSRVFARVGTRRRIFRERSGEEESGVRRARSRAGDDFGARGRDDREQKERTREGERTKKTGEEEDEDDEDDDER